MQNVRRTRFLVFPCLPSQKQDLAESRGHHKSPDSKEESVGMGVAHDPELHQSSSGDLASQTRGT